MSSYLVVALYQMFTSRCFFAGCGRSKMVEQR